jgi:prepilin peptidase CpaA
MLQTASSILLPSLMIVAAMMDVTSYRIPNWLTGLTAALFFPMALLTGMPLVEFGWHVLAGVILFVVGYGLFTLRVFGGGDAKLMAAAGLWFGTSQVMTFLLMTSIAGGVLALAYAAWSAMSRNWGSNAAETGAAVSTKLKKVGPKLPYGFALCVGAILAFPHSWWMNQI